MIFAKSSLTERSADYAAKAKALVAEMTLEEKALLLSGDGWWRTYPIERLQIPAMSVSDGPNGVSPGGFLGYGTHAASGRGFG
jgi:hypothetical protein